MRSLRPALVVGLAVLVTAFEAGPAQALTPNLRIESNRPATNFGEAMADAGDVNGDGIDDIVVGAPEYANGEASEGAIFLFLGRPGGLATGSIDQADARIESNQALARLGVSVASAGDVNGDGYDDVIAGASLWNADEVDEGAAFVFLGGPGGLASGGIETAATLLQGDLPNARFGTSVSHADVNGDGYDDVIAGGRLFQSAPVTSTNEGYAMIFLGGASGIPDGGLATAHAVIQSNHCDALFGYSVAGAGDVNGDGFEDVLIGAPRWTTGWEACADPFAGLNLHEGAALLFLGSATGIDATDPSGADAVISGGQIDGYFGRTVAGVDDLNGDGYDDIAVAATRYDDGQLNEGAVFVFHGSASGIAATVATQANAELQGDQVDTDDTGFTREHFGFGLTSGDWDGDGHLDLLISSSYHDAGQQNEGAAFVFRGSASGVASAGTGSASRILETNVAGAWAGASVALADIDGDGDADAFLGASRMGYPLFPPNLSQGDEGMVLGFPLVTACQNGADDDGDASIDLVDAGCANADDQSEEIDYFDGGTTTVTTAVSDSVLSHDRSNGAPTTVVLAAGGSTTRDLLAIEHSVARVDGGTVQGDLIASDTSTAEVASGTVAGTVIANDGAVVTIGGGNVDAIEAHDTATIELHGLSFVLPNGDIAATSGTIEGTLEDGTPILASFVRDAGAIIRLVPEPGASALALVAAAALAALRRRA